MSLKSILRPDTSVLLGIADGAIIVSLYQHYLPQQASIRTADPHDTDIEMARRHAAWTSAAVLGFMFLLTRDRNSFLIGGLVLGAIDFTVKHSNGMNPYTGQLEGTTDVTISPEIDNNYSLPDYAAHDDGGVLM